MDFNIRLGKKQKQKPGPAKAKPAARKKSAPVKSFSPKPKKLQPEKLEKQVDVPYVIVDFASSTKDLPSALCMVCEGSLLSIKDVRQMFKQKYDKYPKRMFFRKDDMGSTTWWMPIPEGGRRVEI